MNQFVVPQFIDVEDKIFGPITTRQFIILLITGLFLFIVFKLADLQLFIVFLVLFGGFAIILAFIKVNGQSFHYFLLNIFQTERRPSRRIWSKNYSTAELNELRRQPPAPAIEAGGPDKRLSYNRIRDLSLMVNTGGYYQGE